MRNLTFDLESSSRGIHSLNSHRKNGKEIQKRRSRVLPKEKFEKFELRIFTLKKRNFQKIQNFSQRERVSRASEPQVTGIIAETIPVPDRYHTGIYNSKRKKFQRVKSVSSPNLLETALCGGHIDERYKTPTNGPF